MKCSVIYYSARKTSYCEKALKKSFPDCGLNLSAAAFAASKEALGAEIIKAFAQNDVVFTVGGLEFGDGRNVRDILSQAAKSSEPSLCRRLRNENGDDGYLLRAGRQLLVMLPDEPEQIEAMMRGALPGYIKSL